MREIPIGEAVKGWLARAVPNNGCLDWPGARCRKGLYARVRRGGRNTRLHRLVCEHFHGPAPAGKPFAIHSCDRPICINPDHLRWGSAKDNAGDREARGRRPWTLPPPRRGEANPNAKLTEESVRRIRFFVSRGCEQKRVAALMGISQTIVNRVCLGRTWAHVE